MNLDFVCLIIIFALLVLLVTFGDSFSPNGFTNVISFASNSVSAKSIASLDV